MNSAQLRELLAQLREGTGYERIQLERVLTILVEIGSKAGLDLGDIPEILECLQELIRGRSALGSRTRPRIKDRWPNE